MSDGGAVVSVSSDEETLRFTQQIRREIVSSMIGSGKMPDDPREKEILLKTLSDMDRQALTNKRLRNDEGITEAAAIAAKAIEKITALIGNNDPFKSKEQSGRVIDMPTTFDKDFQPVPGEMSIGLDSRDYDQFERDRRVSGS